MSGQQEDYALVRFKEIPAGSFSPDDSPSIIVDAIRDLIDHESINMSHHWESVASRLQDHLFRSIEPVAEEVHQYLRCRADNGTVKFTYFCTDAPLDDFDAYDDLIGSVDSYLLEEFDLRGSSKVYNIVMEPASSIALDSIKNHRVWLAEYREEPKNLCAKESACALTILVEQITDDETNDAAFLLGAHIGSIMTPTKSNRRLIKVVDLGNDRFLYSLATDAALVGLPKNPIRIEPSKINYENETPNWLGQILSFDGSWIQAIDDRKSLASIGHGSHLSDDYMLPMNGRQKLLPFTSYAKEIKEIKFEKFSCRGRSSAAIDQQGLLYTWGLRTDLIDLVPQDNSLPPFNFVSDIIHPFPIQVQSPDDQSKIWKEVATAGSSLFAIDHNDRLWSRGALNSDGQLGLFNNSPSSNLTLVVAEINPPIKWKKVSASEQFTLGLDFNGKLWSWGRNDSGQLGIGQQGDDTNKNNPTLVPDPEGWNGAEWLQVSAGSSHSLGIDDQGRAWAWGNNSVGQLGIGEQGPDTSKNNPTLVTDPEDWNEARWLQVSAGSSHSLGIDDQGRAWAWGDNSIGQLGTNEEGPDTSKNNPTLVTDPEDWNEARWLQVSAGYNYSLGIDDQGRAWAWGKNNYGQLGIGEDIGGENSNYPQDFSDPPDKNVPTQIDGNQWIQIESNAAQIWNFSFGLKTNKRIWAWGNNIFGQLGINQSDGATSIDESQRQNFIDPPDKNVPAEIVFDFFNPITAELGRTRYVRQFGIESLNHALTLFSNTAESNQAWKALGNETNQVILWSANILQVT